MNAGCAAPDQRLPPAACFSSAELLLRFLHLFQPFLPFAFCFRLFLVQFQLSQYLIVVNDEMLNDVLDNKCDHIRHRIIPGKRSRK